MKRIIYREDGGVSVIIPAPKSRQKGESEAKWLKRVFSKATPEGVKFKDVDTAINPLPNRRFRNAWSKGPEGLEVNLIKAKKQVMSELRTARDKELFKTDGLMVRASEIGGQKEVDTLKSYRRKLRDLPATIGVEAITSVDELQAEYPCELTIKEYADKT